MADAPAPLAGVTELADWIGDAIPADTASSKRALLCLRLASSLVREEAGRTWLNSDGTLVTPVPEAASLVTLYCAGRIFDNREAQTRGGLDIYSEGWKVDEAGAYLTASEKRQLAGFKTRAFGGLSTVTTTREPEGPNASGYVPTSTPGVFFPWY